MTTPKGWLITAWKTGAWRTNSWLVGIAAVLLPTKSLDLVARGLTLTLNNRSVNLSIAARPINWTVDEGIR